MLNCSDSCHYVGYLYIKCLNSIFDPVEQSYVFDSLQMYKSVRAREISLSLRVAAVPEQNYYYTELKRLDKQEYSIKNSTINVVY